MRDRIWIPVIAFLLLLPAAIGLGFGTGGVPESALAQGQEAFYREAVLDSANVITATEQSTPVRGWAAADLAGFFLSCTEDSGTATVDAAIQRSFDGTNWASIVTFTQLTATGSQTLLYADVRAASAQMIGDRLRVNYTVGGTGQYTCSVFAAAEG